MITHRVIASAPVQRRDWARVIWPGYAPGQVLGFETARLVPYYAISRQLVPRSVCGEPACLLRHLAGRRPSYGKSVRELLKKCFLRLCLVVAQERGGSLNVLEQASLSIYSGKSLHVHKLAMDAVRNPYASGAGTPPPELAGRSELIAKATVALRRTQSNRPTQSSILVGLRGVGKTVLLVKLAEVAAAGGFHVISVEAHEGKSLPELLAPGLRKVLLSLSAIETAKELSRKGLRVFRSFLSSVKFKVNDIELNLSISPEVGTADSDDLESDLPDLFLAIGHAAKAAKKVSCDLD